MGLATSQFEEGSHPKPGADSEFRDDARSPPRPIDYGRSRSLSWADGVVNGRDCNGVTKIPPMCAILHRDLFDKAWGWERVLPYRPGDIEWPEFKGYLVEYFNNTGKDEALFPKRKLEPVGQSVNAASEHDPLTAAVDLCVEIENSLLATFFEDFAMEDIFLSMKIKERAKQLTGSSGCVSSAAAAALLCITKEDELMYKLLSRRFETSGTVKFGNRVRLSASNLMLYKGSESDVDAAAGIMLGIAKEAELILDMLKRNHPDAFCEYLVSRTLRRFAATALAKLELELAGQTEGTDGDGTNKGDSAFVELNREGSDSMGNSKEGMNQH